MTPGRRVLVALSTEIDSIASFLGLIYAGAVPFSVSSPLVSEDKDAHRRAITHLAIQQRVDHVLDSDDLAGIAEAAGVTSLPSDPAAVPGGGDFSGHPADGGDVAFVQFSSGSTAHPKGVQITHANLMENLNVIVENDRRTADSVMVSWLPLYHDMGLVGGLLSNLPRKNGVVLMHPLCFLMRPIHWLAAITRYGGTLTAIPNFALDLCLERITEEQLEKTPIDLTTFRYIYNGAEPVRPETVRAFEERFARYGLAAGSVRPVYGMSETTLIVTAPRYDEPVVVRNVEGVEAPSVGRPLGDFEVRISGDDGTDLGRERVGEVWLRGSSVTPGYLDPHVSFGVGLNAEGWLATGDLGMLDADGRLYISGRKKDLIIYQGRNFYGHDIAARLTELPQVRLGKVYVFGVDIDRRERVVVMTTAPKREPGVPADPESLDKFKTSIRQFVLKEFGLPVHDVFIVGQIPKTTSGKVSRHRCVQIYRDEMAGASAGD